MEDEDLIKEFREAYPHGSNFLSSYTRAFHEESWEETTANLDVIIKFAKWYASRGNKILIHTMQRNTDLAARNKDIENVLRNIKDHTRWFDSVLKEF